MLGDYMETSEKIVTKLLSNQEIIMRNYADEVLDGNMCYKSYPKYDLAHFMSECELSPNRFDDKYLFVK